MLAYKQTITVTDPQNTVLTGLPFHVGQRVEIVMLADESATPAPSAMPPNTMPSFKRMRVAHIIMPSRDERYER
jgi:hypothetical protein